MLPVSLDSPFLIDPSVFSNVYYINIYCVSLSNIKEKNTTLLVLNLKIQNSIFY